MKKFRLAVLVLGVFLVGCGSSSNSAVSFASDSAEASADYMGTASYAENARNNDFVDQDITGEKLVYRGSVSMETLDYVTTVNAIHEQIQKYHGIIESEEQSNSNYRWYEEDSNDYRTMNVTIRIPTQDFDHFLNDLEGSGHITNKSQSVENITKQYNSNAIEIESLQTQEKRLLEMMKQAETVEDMIAIDGRLAEVQTQLTQLQNNQARMDNDVEYSTIDVYIEEVRKYTPVEYEKYPISDFGENLKEALDTSWRFCVWAVQRFVLLVIELLPIGVVVVLAVIGIRKLIRKIRNRKQK